MLRFFRAVLSAIQDVSVAVRQLRDGVNDISAERSDSSDLDARIQSLELGRAKWQAEVEALVLQAKGQFRAASNAEARERTMKESYEKQSDLGLDDGPEEFEGEGPESVFPIHVPAGEENGLHQVPVGMARTRKATAVNAKYGL